MPRSEADGAAQLARYRDIRAATVALAQPLSAEDQCVQSMPDASPTKWHLAHTSWFFEALLLAPLLPGYGRYDERYHYLFNSYYESLGPRQPRPQRGLITRPGCDEVMGYRAHVDAAMEALLCGGNEIRRAAAPLLELGLHHEQQHQELILTDIKHALSRNPFDPVYRPQPEPEAAVRIASDWLYFPGGGVHIGHDGAGFAFDNERPRHPVLLRPYRLARRLVTCGEYLEFMVDGGYRRPGFWFADGWTAVSEQGWQAPLYWRREAGDHWSVFTLHGRRAVDAAEPVCHLSLYEAAAFAAWAGARLPTEFEWEAAVAGLPVSGRFLADDALQPHPAGNGEGLLQAYGDAWAWTRSAYDPYPGYAPLPGAVGEYNGKFMVGQYVLRGGSCVSPVGHLRPTYRNFLPPGARWQFSGLRLAGDA